MNKQTVTEFADQDWVVSVSKLASLVTAGLMPVAIIIGTWVVVGIRDNRESVIRLEERFENLQTVISAATDEGYRAGDAARDFRLRDLKDSEQDRRITDNEQDINIIRSASPQPR